MNNQNLIIFNFKSLYVILKELEEYLNYNILESPNIKNLNDKIKNSKNYLVITQNKLNNISNQFILSNLPIKISKLIEKLNVQSLKFQFNEKSEFKINHYKIDLNSRELMDENNALKLKKKLENLGSEVHLIKADLNNIDQTQKLLKIAYRKMKGMDCLINNASLFENDNLQNFTEKSFMRHLNINLKAPAILIQNFKRLLKKSEGNIINIIDQRVEKLTPFFFSYTLSKSNLVTLTKTAAMYLAPNIRVNAISPGPTLKNSRQSETHFKKQWKSILLKKKVELKSICDGIKFLIENKNITGEVINIDSGQRLAWNTPDIIKAKE